MTALKKYSTAVLTDSFVSLVEQLHIYESTYVNGAAQSTTTQIPSGFHCLTFVILQCLAEVRVDFAQLDNEAPNLIWPTVQPERSPMPSRR